MGKVNSYGTIICIESNIEEFEFDFDKTLEFCLAKDQSSLEDIKKCVKSDMGNIYQHQMAQKTGDHSYVPWVTVDGIHDIEAENQIIESLIDYLCGNDKRKCYGN